MKSCGTCVHVTCVHVLVGKRMFCTCPTPAWVHYSDGVGFPLNIVKDEDARDCLTYQPREEQK